MEKELLDILHELISTVHAEGGPKHLLLLRVEALQQHLTEKHEPTPKKDSKDGASK